jgi:acyl carrier protein
MERSEIESRVKKVIAGVLKVDEAKLQPETNFIFDLGADSNQSTQLVCALEEEFAVEVDMEKAVEVQNVSGAVEFISGLVNG